ncbi:hypothetical protein E3P86_00714 [Wallemia ichthyophaga]|uniref:Nudix hydrolase domain-containing protein n=1 Tax=Wallemia ichthyophaga TaxID=245174 RepID=A0A4T0JCU0_WALIC|nr:hypothetical protein E3P86_00714 [Wallemia ichthyophaga]
MKMIELIRELNNFNPKGFIPLKHNTHTIGYINKQLIGFVNIPPFTIKHDSVIYTHSSVQRDSEIINLHFRTLKEATDTPLPVKHELNGWRNEDYGVYSADNSLLFTLERAAAGILGIPTYGIHLTAFTPDYKLWIPRRSPTKQTYPAMLDNTVAGGIAFGDSVLHTVIKECQEEANLPSEIIHSSLKSTGVVTYFYMKQGLFAQPEIQFVFDLKVDQHVTPTPNDGEVQSFSCISVDQAIANIHDRQFKPNCALVLIDFFVRHGFISPDIDEYIELTQNMHRQLPLSNIFTPK